MKRILLFILFLLFLATAFQSDKISTSGWYQQFLPNLNGRPISDITFLDSLIGFSVTPYIANDTAYILKTTNGGDNWLVIFRQPTNTVGGFNRIQFINQQTGFACGNFLWKTTNEGMNWFNVNTSSIFPMNMYVLNQDTIWLIDSESLTGGVFRTTNGGLNWTQQFSGGTENPNEIYMYNARIGFISGNPSPRKIRKTTDGGNSWFIVLTNDYFADMYFADSLTGWKCSVFGMKKTTDGGLNWVTQQIPDGGNIIVTGVQSFSNINNDTIWGAGGTYLFPNNQFRGILYRTTNGGSNWYYQIPDTTIHLGGYSFINFVNKNNGWANTTIHTTTGGDSLFYTGVIQTNTEVPNDYKLFQNYPNPFNPKTTIEYEIKRGGFITLEVYDIRGKEMMTLVSQKQTPGKYLVDFPGVLFPSGVYFYRLSVDEIPINTKKMILIK